MTLSGFLKEGGWAYSESCDISLEGMCTSNHPPHTHIKSRSICVHAVIVQFFSCQAVAYAIAEKDACLQSLVLSW